MIAISYLATNFTFLQVCAKDSPRLLLIQPQFNDTQITLAHDNYMEIMHKLRNNWNLIQLIYKKSCDWITRWVVTRENHFMIRKIFLYLFTLNLVNDQWPHSYPLVRPICWNDYRFDFANKEHLCNKYEIFHFTEHTFLWNVYLIAIYRWFSPLWWWWVILIRVMCL